MLFCVYYVYIYILLFYFYLFIIYIGIAITVIGDAIWQVGVVWGALGGAVTTLGGEGGAAACVTAGPVPVFI